jgi:hypothetical protein
MTRKRVEISVTGVAATLAKRLLGLLVVSALLIVSRTAAAIPERVVLLTKEQRSEALDEIDGQLLVAAKGQLAEIGIDVVLMPGARDSLASNAQIARKIAVTSPTLAVVWFERRANTLVVFFYDPAGPRLYSRQFAASGAPAAASEEIAIVLRSAVNAVIEGGAVGMAEVRLPEPQAEQPKPLREKKPKAKPLADEPGTDSRADAMLRIGASYVGALYAVGSAWQSGGALSLSLKPPEGLWFVGLAYTYFPALTIDELGTQSEIRRHPGELFAGVEIRLVPIWFVAEGALIADLMERSTERVRAGLTPTADSQRWLWAFSTRIGGAVPLADRARCFFTVGAEFLLNRFDHVVETEGSATTVASPMRARPRIELGLLVGLW